MNTSSITAIVVAVVLVLVGTGVIVFTLSNRPVSEEGAVQQQTSNQPAFPDIENYEEQERAATQSSERILPFDNYEAPTDDEDFFDPDDDYTNEIVYDNTAPAFSDAEIDDGTADTNTALDERQELREETPRPQALPQPIQETLEETEQQVDEEVAPTVSKYLGMVEFKGSSGAKSDVDREHIVLTADSKNDTNVTITGWKFRSAVTGKEIHIGTAERLFISGSSVPKEPIVLEPKGKVTFVTQYSPIGFDFVVTICSGYLNQFNEMYPNVSNKCPKPEDEILFWDGDQSIFLDNDCMDFVDSIGKCSIVEDDEWEPEVSPTCRQAITENLGYNICVNRHRNEPDFYFADQRVYLDRGSKIWREDREIIELIDEDGFVVDFIEY